MALQSCPKSLKPCSTSYWVQLASGEETVPGKAATSRTGNSQMQSEHHAGNNAPPWMAGALKGLHS